MAKNPRQRAAARRRRRMQTAANTPDEIRRLDQALRNRAACERKKAFPIRVKADTYALHVMNHPQAKRRLPFLRSYHCPSCGQWHLTSKPG